MCYEKVNIFKPTTSRLSNSEKYIVCEKFLGYNEQIVTEMEKNYNDGNMIIDIPQKFIKEILEYNDYFVHIQINTIKEIIKNIDYDGDIKPTKEQIKNANDWCLKYNLPINNKCIYKA